MAIPTTTIWSPDPQTKAKHAILRKYLGGWFAVMGHTTERIVFFDAFAGPGEYSDGSPGSPLIALETLLNHRVVTRECEFVLLFNESDLERFNNLVSLLDRAIADRPLPENVKVIKSNQEFTDLGNELSQIFGDSQGSLAPRLVFVDPFGVSEAPLVTLQKILSFPKCEVFAYLNVNLINRFGTAGNIDGRMEALFGTSDFRLAPPARDPNRITYFVELYEAQLRLSCGFKYTLSFQMKNPSGILIYVLVFATNNLKGLSLMKDAMWAVAPDGSYSFSARYSNQDILLQVGVDYESLADALGAQFAGRSVVFESVKKFILVDTPYREVETRPTLKVLEASGRISVTRNFGTGPRIRGTFPEDSVITFA